MKYEEGLQRIQNNDEIWDMLGKEDTEALGIVLMAASALKRVAEENYKKGYAEALKRVQFENISPPEAEREYIDGKKVFCLDTKTFELIDLQDCPYGYAIQKFATAGDLFFVMR